MQFSLSTALAILAFTFTSPLTRAAPAPEPSISVTVFSDLECATPALETITLTVNGTCVAPTSPFQSFLIPNNAAAKSLGDGCGFIALSDENCAHAKTENVIEPFLGAGRCIPTIFYGNFAGPEFAEALELVCGPFI